MSGARVHPEKPWIPSFFIDLVLAPPMLQNLLRESCHRGEPARFLLRWCLARPRPITSGSFRSGFERPTGSQRGLASCA
jgi:hypothetical protein